MRIALFTEVFLPKIDGIVTRVTRSLENLADLGHEVLVFAPGDPPAEYAGFEVYRIPSSKLWVYPELKWGWPDPRLIKRLREFDPDVIHAVNPIWTSAFGVLLAQLDAYPLVCSFHTNIPEYTDALGVSWLRPITEKALNYLHGRASVNLCTSAPMVDKARALGFPNVSLWPKAVDTQLYRPDKADSAMRERLTDGHPDAPLVTYIGRISKEKDLDRMAHVMELVREKVPGARLAMVGEGPHFEQIQKDFAKQGEDAVFTGYLTGEDLAAAFASGDVFAFPSATETLGLVALESFASGVPVVGTRAGGIPFVIDEGRTGELINADAGDEAWAAAVAELLLDDARRKRMGEAARAEAEKFSWRESTLALVDAYQEAIDGPLYRG